MTTLLPWAHITDSKLDFLHSGPENPFQLRVSLVDSGQTLASNKYQGVNVLFELWKPFFGLIVEVGNISQHSSLEGISDVSDGVSNPHLSEAVLACEKYEGRSVGAEEVYSSLGDLNRINEEVDIL